ncbi:MAG: protein-methionine-sulfoxide reductase catalytic subunit MsrP [Candidatus Methylomirabilales bacterium]
MPSIPVPKGWEIPEREATPDDVYWNRRRVLKALGFLGLGAASGILSSCDFVSAGDPVATGTQEHPPVADRYPAPRNPRFTLDRPLTPERVAATYNNFYEFSSGKKLWNLSARLTTHPWQVEVAGLVAKPRTYDVDALIRQMPLEERLYRFRCVEAWAMVVPWTGFPLRALIKLVEPLSSARYVRFTTFYRPTEAPRQRYRDYPWPYTEGLTMAEAMNELTLVATGIYGHPLPKQHGAPLRLVTPWKYGFKSIKSIVRIEFTTEQPATFWNTLLPHEYDFWANVNPAVPHPRWSQAQERMIDTGEYRPTLLYNGYGEQVAHLYRI